MPPFGSTKHCRLEVEALPQARSRQEFAMVRADVGGGLTATDDLVMLQAATSELVQRAASDTKS